MTHLQKRGAYRGICPVGTCARDGSNFAANVNNCSKQNCRRRGQHIPIILVHNHPGGDPTPSRADIEMTQAIVAVARPLGIAVHDHIIVGRDGHASLKGLRLI